MINQNNIPGGIK